MYEKEKLEEAKYFYSRMVEEQLKKENFRHNLSAFLSSARSVLQYSLAEAQGISGGQAWYDNFVLKHPTLKFFGDKRNINIHYRPITPAANYKVTIGDTLGLSDSVTVIVRDKNGNIKSQHSSEPYSKSKPIESKTTIQVRYEFDDWKGPEDVLTLSQKYLQELGAFIDDGVSKGFITG